METADTNRSVQFTATLDRPVGEIITLVSANAPYIAAGVNSRGVSHAVVALEVPLGIHGTVTRSAVVRLGVPEPDAGSWRLPITIAALDSERWFPTFVGALGLSDAGMAETSLTMAGTYELPLGPLGRASAPLGGQRAARSSLYALFLGVVGRAERVLKETAPAWRPAPAGDSLRDPDRPVGAS